MHIDDEGLYDVDSDHNLFIIDLGAQSADPTIKKTTNETFHRHWKLRDEDNLKLYTDKLETALTECNPASYDEFVQLIKDIGMETCGKTIPSPNKRRNKPKWLTDEIKAEIKTRKAANQAHRRAVKNGEPKSTVNEKWIIYKQKKRAVVSLVTKARRKIDEALTKELSRKDKTAVKKFWRHLKQHKKARTVKGIRDANGHLQHTTQGIQEAVETHFADPPKVTCQNDVGQRDPIDPISSAETSKILDTLPTGKATGIDDIPYEFIKHLGEKGRATLTRFYNNILQGEPIPQNWKMARTQLIYKGKGKCSERLDSYRPIAILSNMYKTFASILKARLTARLESEQKLGDVQFGFRKNRSTSDGLHLLDQAIEHAKTNKKYLFTALLDIKAAYDRVNREILWQRLQEIGVDTDTISLIQEIYTGTSSAYVLEDIETHQMPTNIGLRQGCPLSSLLFIIYLTPLETALLKHNAGYPFSQDLRVPGIFYADDIIILADSAANLQTLLNTVSSFAEQSDVTFSTDKSEIIIFGDHPSDTDFTLQGSKLTIAETVTYLGVRFSSKTEHHLSPEIARRQEKIRKLKYTVLANSRNTFNRFQVTRTLWKQVATPCLTYANDALSFPKHLWSECDKAQLSIGRHAVGASYISPNITIEGELGWSSFGLRAERSMLNYAGHLMRSPPESILRKTHDIMRQQKNTSEWHRRVWKARVRNQVGTNLHEHPTKSKWNKDIKDSLNKKNEEKWRKEVQNKPSLTTYKCKSSIHPEDNLYDNSLGSDLLYQARTGSLPTAHRHHCIYNSDPICKLCDRENETIDHVLYRCPKIERPNGYPPLNNDIEEALRRHLGFAAIHPQLLATTKRILENWWSASGKAYPYWRKQY